MASCRGCKCRDEEAAALKEQIRKLELELEHKMLRKEKLEKRLSESTIVVSPTETFILSVNLLARPFVFFSEGAYHTSWSLWRGRCRGDWVTNCSLGSPTSSNSPTHLVHNSSKIFITSVIHSNFYSWHWFLYLIYYRFEYREVLCGRVV